jgi:hypothetical protein
VNALRRIHAALVPGGLVVDTQPVSARPSVEAFGVELGTLDMDEWRGTIDAVDRLVAETIDDGFFALQAESELVVTDAFDDGPEMGGVGERLAWDADLGCAGASGRLGDAADQRASAGADAAPARPAVRFVTTRARHLARWRCRSGARRSSPA